MCPARRLRVIEGRSGLEELIVAIGAALTVPPGLSPAARAITTTERAATVLTAIRRVLPDVEDAACRTEALVIEAEIRAGVAAPSVPFRPPILHTHLTPDGGACLTGADLGTATSALNDGMRLRGQAVGLCRSCAPGQPCSAHEADAGLLVSYRQLVRLVGGPRASTRAVR